MSSPDDPVIYPLEDLQDSLKSLRGGELRFRGLPTQSTVTDREPVGRLLWSPQHLCSANMHSVISLRRRHEPAPTCCQDISIASPPFRMANPKKDRPSRAAAR